jgi:hypothetical protein
MSHKFIEFGFPCNECLVAAACKDKKRIKNEDLLDRTGGVRCLALPAFDHNTSSHQKMLIECLAKMLCRITPDLNEDRNMKIPQGYRHFLIQYLSVLEWITNSTSWRENFDEVKYFDREEIKFKLKHIGKFLDWKGDIKE